MNEGVAREMINPFISSDVEGIRVLAPIKTQEVSVSCSLKELINSCFNTLKSPTTWQVCIFSQENNTLAYCLTRDYPQNVTPTNIYRFSVPKLIENFQEAFQKALGDGAPQLSKEALCPMTMKMEKSRLCVVFSLEINGVTGNCPDLLISNAQKRTGSQLLEEELNRENRETQQPDNGSTIIAFCKNSNRVQNLLCHLAQTLADCDIDLPYKEKQAEEMITSLCDQINFEGSQESLQEVVQLFCQIPQLNVSDYLKNKATCGVIKKLCHKQHQKISPPLLEVLIPLAQAAREHHRRNPSIGQSKPWADLFITLVMEGKLSEEVLTEETQSLFVLLSLLSACIDQHDFSKKIDDALKGKNAPLFYLKAFLLLKEPFYLFKLSSYPFDPHLLDNCPKINENMASAFSRVLSVNLKHDPHKSLCILQYMEALTGIETCYPHWTFIWNRLAEDKSSLESSLIDSLKRGVKDQDSCLKAYVDFYLIPPVASWLESSPFFDLIEDASLIFSVKTRLDMLVESDKRAAFALMVKAKELEGFKDVLETHILRFCGKELRVYFLQIATHMDAFIPFLLSHEQNRSEIETCMNLLTHDVLCHFSASIKHAIALIFAKHLFNSSFVSQTKVDLFVERFCLCLNTEELLQVTFDCAKKKSKQFVPLFEAGAIVLSQLLCLKQIESLQEAHDWFSMVLTWNEKTKALPEESLGHYAGMIFNAFVEKVEINHPFFALFSPYLTPPNRQLFQLKWSDKLSDCIRLFSIRLEEEKGKSYRKKGWAKEVEMAKNVLNQFPLCLFENNSSFASLYLSLVSFIRFNQGFFPQEVNMHIREIQKWHDIASNELIIYVPNLLPESIKILDFERIAQSSIHYLCLHACFNENDHLICCHLDVLCFWMQEGHSLPDEIKSCLCSILTNPTELRDPSIYSRVLAILLIMPNDALDWLPLIESMLSRKICWDDKILITIASKDVTYLKEILIKKIDSLIDNRRFVLIDELVAQFYSYFLMVSENQNVLDDVRVLSLVGKIADFVVMECHISPSETKNLSYNIRGFTALALKILMKTSHHKKFLRQIMNIYLIGHFNYVICETKHSHLHLEGEIHLYFDYIEWIIACQIEQIEDLNQLEKVTKRQDNILKKIGEEENRERARLMTLYADRLHALFMNGLQYQLDVTHMGVDFIYKLLLEHKRFPNIISQILEKEVNGIPFCLFIFQSTRDRFHADRPFPYYYAYVTFRVYFNYVQFAKYKLEPRNKEILQQFEEECWNDSSAYFRCFNSQFLVPMNYSKEELDKYVDMTFFLLTSKLDTYFLKQNDTMILKKMENEELLGGLLLLIHLSVDKSEDLLKSMIDKEKASNRSGRHSYVDYLKNQKEVLSRQCQESRVNFERIENILSEKPV